MGAYVMKTLFQTSCISSGMFITAMAANPLAVDLAKGSLGETIRRGRAPPAWPGRPAVRAGAVRGACAQCWSSRRCSTRCTNAGRLLLAMAAVQGALRVCIWPRCCLLAAPLHGHRASRASAAPRAAQLGPVGAGGAGARAGVPGGGAAHPLRHLPARGQGHARRARQGQARRARRRPGAPPISGRAAACRALHCAARSGCEDLCRRGPLAAATSARRCRAAALHNASA